MNVGDPDLSPIEVPTDKGKSKELGWTAGNQIGHTTEEAKYCSWREGPWTQLPTERKRHGNNRFSNNDGNKIEEDNAV